MPQSHATNEQSATKASIPMTPKNTQGDRNALRVPVMEDGLRGWSYDIFDCFADLRTCMCGLRSTTLLSLQYTNSLVIQAPYLLAVAAIAIHGTSVDWSTLRPTALPFANRSKRAIVTVSGIAFSDKRPRHCRFVCHSHLLRHLVINFRVSIGHWQI